jgi:hypothetical protein
MPMFRSCMSPVTTPPKPASASTPLAVITPRIETVSRLPPKTAAANNIESAKKEFHPRISSAYTTEGHLNDTSNQALATLDLAGSDHGCLGRDEFVG